MGHKRELIFLLIFIMIDDFDINREYSSDYQVS